MSYNKTIGINRTLVANNKYLPPYPELHKANSRKNRDPKKQKLNKIEEGNETNYNNFFNGPFRLKKNVSNKLLKNSNFTKKFISYNPYAIKYVESKLNSFNKNNSDYKMSNSNFNKFKEYAKVALDKHGPKMMILFPYRIRRELERAPMLSKN